MYDKGVEGRECRVQRAREPGRGTREEWTDGECSTDVQLQVNHILRKVIEFR